MISQSASHMLGARELWGMHVNVNNAETHDVMRSYLCECMVLVTWCSMMNRIACWSPSRVTKRNEPKRACRRIANQYWGISFRIMLTEIPRDPFYESRTVWSYYFDNRVNNIGRLEFAVVVPNHLVPQNPFPVPSVFADDESLLRFPAMSLFSFVFRGTRALGIEAIPLVFSLFRSGLIDPSRLLLIYSRRAFRCLCNGNLAS
jgi:hypothetical protein